MPDFGLVLAEHDLTPQEFKELARRIGRAAFVPLFLKFYDRVITSEATIEEQRKALADIGRWTGVEEQQKIDPNANLPVFNFIFGASGSVSATMVSEPQALPDKLPDVIDEQLLDAIAGEAAVRGLMPRLKEVHDALDQQQAEKGTALPEAPAGGGLPAAPEPKRKRSSKHVPAATRPEQLPLPLPAVQGAAGVPDGDPVIGSQEPVRGAARNEPPALLSEEVARDHDSFEDALASIDAALGI